VIIDAEHHLFLEEQTAGTFRSGKICERFWEDGKLKIKISKQAANVENHLRFMDDAGIDMAILTANQLKGLDQMKRSNERIAQVMKKYPKRYVGFGSVPPTGGKPALEELERAVNGLGLRGVHIWTRSDGACLDSRDMWPFYEKVAQLDVPIDIHILGELPGYDALHAPYALYYVVMREFDMAASVLRVCLGGVLEDFPDLKIIMNHFGGGVSSIIERLDAYTSYADQPGWPGFYSGKRLISKPWREYFNKLYFNMAGREVGMEALRCALTNISPKKLLFGTDWPFNFDYEPAEVKSYVAKIRALDLPREDIDAMLGGNAARLLGV
jgi:aminocarboxymuconate-semialdehyde decarboxylase